LHAKKYGTAKSSPATRIRTACSHITMDKRTDHVHFGLWIYLMSDCVLFASLFAAYAVLYTATAGGPTPADIFDTHFVLIETLILLTSSFASGLAALFANSKRQALTWAALLITFALGATFLGMELHEFGKLVAQGYGPQRSAFLSSFFTLVGTHGLHIFFGLVWMVDSSCSCSCADSRRLRRGALATSPCSGTSWILSGYSSLLSCTSFLCYDQLRSRIRSFSSSYARSLPACTSLGAFALPILLSAALLQLFVQLRFFLHLGKPEMGGSYTAPGSLRCRHHRYSRGWLLMDHGELEAPACA
jgi:heme/copper-type cytochrome/quinol oxidase subunit 3